MASRTQEVFAYCCSHEGANARILFNASHAVQCGADINLQDTDVVALAILASHEIPAQLIFHTGAKLESRYVDITSLGRTLGSDNVGPLSVIMHSMDSIRQVFFLVGVRPLVSSY